MDFNKSITSVQHFTDIPELVVYKLFENLPKFSDLKSLRLVCSTTKSWVDNYLPFYDKFIIKINSGEVLNNLIEQAEERDSRFWTNCQLSSDSVEFQDYENFSQFLEKYAMHVRHLQIVNYPFKSLNLDFLSCFENLVSLEFIGTWAIACFFDFAPPKNLTRKLKMLNFNLSCVGLRSPEFQKFGKFLSKFTSLQNLKISCDQNQQLLFRQLLAFVASCFSDSKSIEIDMNAIEDFVTNPETEFYGGVKNVCEFCCELEMDFTMKITEKVNSIENLFFVFVAGLKTISVGHNVSFPLFKFENIGWISIQMSKFNYPESFCRMNEEHGTIVPFHNLKNLHLALKNDFDLVELQKALKVFGKEGNQIEKLVLELPNARLEEKDEVMSEFLSHFQKLKVLHVHNWFSPVWLLPPRLEKLVLFSITNITN